MDRAIITTGGTGGHIFPALAVAEELRASFPGVEILFVGGEYGPEKRLAGEAGIDFVGLPVRGFLGRGFKALGAAWGLLRGIRIARREIKKFRPDVVIGFGGYAAAASVLAARCCKVPVLLHEQNSIPGLSNRLAGRFAAKICISLPDAEACFPSGKTVLTGNPVRRSIIELHEVKKERRKQSRSACKGGRNLLVLGGSQGAMAVNSAVLEDLPALLEAGVNVWIQSGQSDYERVKEALAQMGSDGVSGVRLNAFITDMGEAYAWADLAVCRAGATTVAELASSAVPAIFVPFPYATHNHQYFNAVQVQKLGAAQVLEQKDITPGKVGEMVLELFDNPERLEGMTDSAMLIAIPDAAAKVAAEAEKLVSSGK